jgi:6-phosphogluconolactonase
VQSFSVSKDGKLSFISRVKSAGTLPCHVNADRNARTVLVANYGSGTVASIALDEEGKLWPPPPSHVVQHRGNDTQTPHAHHVPFSGATGRNVLAVDLGLDRVYQYTLGAQNELLPHSSMPFISLPDGAGPRHVKPHPHLSVAYVLNELGSSIATFHYDRASGYLGTQLELLPTLAPGQNTTGNFPAEVVVHPNGRHVYSSNRGDESIVQFDIDQSTGRLTFVRTTPTGGSWPRHFTLDPTGTRMLVANQRGNNIVTFQVDPNTGHVTRMNVPEISIPGPACVQFLEL